MATVSNRLLIFVSLAVLAVGAAFFLGRATAGDDEGSSGGSTPLISIEFGPSQIWEPSSQAITDFGSCGPDIVAWRDCVWTVMQREGASQDAFDFFKLTDGFLIGLEGEGNVKLGTVLYRWRANENQQLVLLGGDPAVVYPEELPARIVEGNTDYQALKAQQPNVLIWTSGPQLEAQTTNPDGSQTFVLRYRLLDGCHACAVLGYARVEYDFAANGRQVTPTPKLLGIVGP